MDEAGNYSVQFNATSLPNGIYFNSIEAGANVAVCKMILLKESQFNLTLKFKSPGINNSALLLSKV